MNGKRGNDDVQARLLLRVGELPQRRVNQQSVQRSLHPGDRYKSAPKHGRGLRTPRRSPRRGGVAASTRPPLAPLLLLT